MALVSASVLSISDWSTPRLSRLASSRVEYSDHAESPAQPYNGDRSSWSETATASVRAASSGSLVAEAAAEISRASLRRAWNYWGVAWDLNSSDLTAPTYVSYSWRTSATCSE